MDTKTNETTTSTRQQRNDVPRIYVACLASYNSGILHGSWIDCDQSADDIHAEIKAMLEESPELGAEEWAIHDTENFGGINISEYCSIETVAFHAEMLGKHGDAWDAFTRWVCDHEATEERFEETYRGEWSSEVDFAEELYRDCHTIPEFLDSYIDWERIASDLFMDGFHSVEANYKCFVFSDY